MAAHALVGICEYRMSLYAKIVYFHKCRCSVAEIAEYLSLEPWCVRDVLLGGRHERHKIPADVVQRGVSGILNYYATRANEIAGQ